MPFHTETKDAASSLTPTEVAFLHALSLMAGNNATNVGAGSGLSKGDIFVYNGSSMVRLPVGSDTQVLTADSTQATGIKWAAGGGGGGMAIGGTITSATQGSVLFAGSGGVLAQDNTKFFYDQTNTKFGVGTNTPAATITAVREYTIGGSIPTTKTMISAGRFLIVNSNRSFYFDIFTSPQPGAEFSTFKYDDSSTFPMHFQVNGGNASFGNTTNVPGSTVSIYGGLSVGTSYQGTASPSNGAIIQGNVGIGNNSPGTPLDVASTVNSTLRVRSSNTTGTAIDLQNSSAGAKNFQFFATGSANTPGNFGIYNATDSKTSFVLQGSNGDVNLISGATFGWSSDASDALTNAKDTGFKRAAAGIISVTNGSTGTGKIRSLILDAGTAAAGRAPMYLISGTALGTPEDGALEYHTSHIYFTIGSTRYQLDQQSGGGTPGGSNTQVQFNDGGVFGGDAGFTYAKATDTASLGNLLLNGASTIANTPLVIQVTAAGGGFAVVGTSTFSPQFSLYNGATQRGAFGLALDVGNYSILAAAGDVVLRQTGAGSGTLFLTNQSSGAISFTTGTSTSNDSLKMSIANNGSITMGITSVSPLTNDGAALGTTALQWSDQFLASGGVINWNNGNATLTHSAGLLTSNVPIRALAYAAGKAASGFRRLDILIDASTYTQGIGAEATNASDPVLGAYVTGDSFLRFDFLANGQMEWGGGALAVDTRLYRNAANQLKTDGSFIAATSLIAGVAGGTTGSLILNGTTSGVVTVTTAAAAGTWTFTLPTSGGTSGYVLSTNGSGTTSWIAAGAGDMVLASAQTNTGAKTFNAGTLLDKGEIVFDIKAYGAVGNDTADDTAAIQAAVDAAQAAGGGKVWGPKGTYKITAAIKLYSGTTPTITAYSNITIEGVGASGVSGTIFKQYTTGADVIKGINDAANGAQILNITLRNFSMAWGTATLTNSGNGLYLSQQAAGGPSYQQITIENVTAVNMQGSGKYGFNFESIIVSSVRDCQAQVCANGFYINGAVGGSYNSVSTSTTFSNCYANMATNGVNGFRCTDNTYMQFINCAVDVGANSTGSAYLVEGSNSVNFISCGIELNGTATLTNGFHIKADASSNPSSQIGIYQPYIFQSKSTKEVYVTGASVGVIIDGAQSNSSVSGSTGLTVDAGSEVTERSTNWDVSGVATPRSINATAIWSAFNNGALTLAKGTATQAPAIFQAGTNKTTAGAGEMEYDGKAFYANALASSRQVMMAVQFLSLTSTYNLTSTTSAQKLFNTSTNGALTVGANTTYQFECFYTLTSMSASSASFGFALGGTATITSQAWVSEAQKPTSFTGTTNTPNQTFNTAANTALTGNTTATNGMAYIRGSFRVTTAGTIIPQVSLGVAAVAVVGINSFFRCWVDGSNTVVNVGNWS